MPHEAYAFRSWIGLFAILSSAIVVGPAIAGNPATSENPASTPPSSAADSPASPPAKTELAAKDLLAATGLLATATAPPARSENVTVNLINRLVERGVLTKQDAQELIRLAEEDAGIARAQTDTFQHDIAVARQTAQIAVQQTAPPATGDEVEVNYIPEAAQDRIREELRDDVMARAKEENWAAPNAIPDWVTKFRVSGDIRIRYEGDFFPGGNDNTGAFPNFNAINIGAPFDISGTAFSPQQDVDQNRTRFRIRARIGAEIDMGEGFTVGLRIGTGQDNSPVSENQTLGLANNGQGGDFSKYQVWIDRAFLRWELGGQPNKNLAITIGRMDNPFFDPTTLMWSHDIGFDGLAAQAKYEVVHGITPFINGGAFPIFNTDFNYATNNPSKFKSEDKYLFAGQIGTNLKIAKDLTAKVAAGYFYFYNIEGKLSSPFSPLTSSDQGNTDDSRPSFAQNGNTYMALRDIVPTADNDFGTIDQFQYFGLASKFQDLTFTGRLDYNHFEPVQISLYGEYARNLALDRGYANGVAVNNRGANTVAGGVGSWSGGGTAWIIGLQIGHAALEKRGDWNVGIDYRYLQSDSVVDAFNDVNFGTPLSGTNLKGFTIGANLALSHNVWLGFRWMSADNIIGPQFKSDVLQIDINGKF